jgi:hypothetical protein
MPTKDTQSEPKASQEEHLTYSEVITLLEWTAPGRPWRKRGKTYFGSLLLITLLIEIILFLFSQYLLMLTVASLTFLTIVLAAVPPHPFRYRISSEGVFVEDRFYLWMELYDFYFKDRDGEKVLHIRTRAMLPGEITLTLGNLTEGDIKQVLLPHLAFREYIHPSLIDRAGNWLSRTFPLEERKFA